MKESTERFPISNSSKYFRLMIVKDNHEKYILTFDRSSVKSALEELGKWAADAELTFTWYDAAITAPKIKNHFKYRDIK